MDGWIDTATDPYELSGIPRRPVRELGEGDEMITYNERDSRVGQPVNVGDWTVKGRVIAVAEDRVTVKFDGMTCVVVPEAINAERITAQAASAVIARNR